MDQAPSVSMGQWTFSNLWTFGFYFLIFLEALQTFPVRGAVSIQHLIGLKCKCIAVLFLLEIIYTSYYMDYMTT